MSSDGARGDARTARHVYLELARGHAREQVVCLYAVWVVCLGRAPLEVEGATSCHGSVSAFLVSGH